MAASFQSSHSQQQLYVLQCNHKKYYIGKTSLPLDLRFQQHLHGRGAAWTRIHRPVRIVESCPYRPFEELRVTLEYMKRYGIDNVRGAEWCSVELSVEEIDEIQRKIISEEGRCYSCHQLGHMISSCPYKHRGCYHCRQLDDDY